jgi:hypothetical protein
MIVLMKFLHFFGLMLGSAAAFGSFAVARQVRRDSGQPPSQLLVLGPFFARTALVAILLLWLTGSWLYFEAYSDIDLGLVFHFKLAAAALLLASIIVVNVAVRRAETPPPSWLPQLHVAARILLVLAVACAVYVFD